MRQRIQQLKPIIVGVVFVALLVSGCGPSNPGTSTPSSSATTGSTFAVTHYWKNYAHLWNTPTDTPWIVVMCKFSDVPDEPAGLFQEAQDFITTQGAGTGNMTDYWSDVSYGAITLAGSQVVGWYTTPISFASLTPTSPTRNQKAQTCADQAAKDVNFSKFYGVISVYNKVNDAGGCGIRGVVEQGHQLACVLFDTASFFTAFAAQEMGHGYGPGNGLSHSSNQAGCVYCDPYDVMSTCNGTWSFQGPNYGSPLGCGKGWDGPGLNAPNLIQLGWIPQSRVRTYTIDSPPVDVTLAALSHPEAQGDLVAQVDAKVPPGVPEKQFFTIEFRTPDGWDSGFPGAFVLIHEYVQGQSYPTFYSFLQTTDTDKDTGQLVAGDIWTGSWPGGALVTVGVLSISSTTATIQIQTS